MYKETNRYAIKNCNENANRKKKFTQRFKLSTVVITFIFISAQFPDLHSWYALSCAKKNIPSNMSDSESWEFPSLKYSLLDNWVFPYDHHQHQVNLALAVKELLEESVGHCRVLGQRWKYFVARVILKKRHFSFKKAKGQGDLEEREQIGKV